MKGREYLPEKGDIAIFACPPNRITENARQILEDNNISLYEYSSTNVEELLKLSTQKVEVREEFPTEIKIEEEEKLLSLKSQNIL
ncbi:unnamed protein product [marine sediment metagenome]|uniref:Uncharacterized protein n=1 Tax=marine sediment metagenome TaxID=412755 RepID=X1AI43_9ZZZZ